MLTLLESHSQRTSVHIASSSGGLSALSGQQSFSRFVNFQLGDFTVGSIDWNLHLGTVLLGGNNLLDVDAPSSSVDGEDLSSLASHTVLHRASVNSDSVSLSNWNCSCVPLGLEILAQSATHDLSSDAAWCGEVSLSGLSSLTGHSCSIQRVSNSNRVSLTGMSLHVILVNNNTPNT